METKIPVKISLDLYLMVKSMAKEMKQSLCFVIGTSPFSGTKVLWLSFNASIPHYVDFQFDVDDDTENQLCREDEIVIRNIRTVRLSDCNLVLDAPSIVHDGERIYYLPPILVRDDKKWFRGTTGFSLFCGEGEPSKEWRITWGTKTQSPPYKIKKSDIVVSFVRDIIPK